MEENVDEPRHKRTLQQINNHELEQITEKC